MFHTVYCCCTTQQFRILKFSVKPLWIIDYFENWLDGIQLWFCEKTEERGDSSLARKLHPLGSKCEISWWEWEEGSPLLKMHIFVSKCICSEPQQIKNSLAAELNKFLFMTLYYSVIFGQNCFLLWWFYFKLWTSFMKIISYELV